MSLKKYTYFTNYTVSEIEVTCYNYTNEQSKLEHAIFKLFDVYDDELIFEKDKSMSFILTYGKNLKNVQDLNVFTNFKTCIDLSVGFVNILFVYSISITNDDDDDVMTFVDFYIQAGKIINDACIGCIFNDSFV